MRYVDEYRAPEQVMQLVAHLQQRARLLPHTAARPLRIMEVCGGHTHAIFKFGLDQLLPENIEFIHGPGCPVCVLPMGRIDACIEIASRPGVIFCTFGDAMRVPGKNGSLLQAKARGADVRIVYSPMDALRLAQQNPQREVVFFGLGFETTMPATALTLRQARERNVDNFYFFCQHITLLPTLRSLLDQPENGIDAFLAPGHVSMVIGTEAYGFIASDYHRPLVVAGFEPLDLLQGAVMLVEQTIAQRSAAMWKISTVAWCRMRATRWRRRRWPTSSAWMATANGAAWGSSATPACSLRQPISASMPRRIFARRRSACATTRAPAAARC